MLQESFVLYAAPCPNPILFDELVYYLFALFSQSFVANDFSKMKSLLSNAADVLLRMYLKCKCVLLTKSLAFLTLITNLTSLGS